MLFFIRSTEITVIHFSTGRNTIRTCMLIEKIKCCLPLVVCLLRFHLFKWTHSAHFFSSLSRLLDSFVFDETTDCGPTVTPCMKRTKNKTGTTCAQHLTKKCFFFIKQSFWVRSSFFFQKNVICQIYYLHHLEMDTITLHIKKSLILLLI